MQDPAASAVGRVAQVNVGSGGVPKLPVDRAQVGRLGLEGDAHREPEPIHGGQDQAVCLYAAEAIARVAADGHRAFPGAFGENLTTEGIAVGLLPPGTRLQVGDGGLLLEITKHCQPCSTLEHLFEGGRIARISAKVRPEDARQYARVIMEGPVATGDSITVVGPAAHDGYAPAG